MKKIIPIVCSLLIISSFAHARSFFADRYFEIHTDAEVNAANNTLKIPDYLKKDVVIDLEKIASEMPDNGLNLAINAFPKIDVKLNIPERFSLEFSSNIETYSSFTMSKDVFDFLAKGNSDCSELNVSADGYVDVFAGAQLDIGLQFGKLRFDITPGIFAPVVHGTASNAYLKFNNTDDGEFIIDACAGFKLYTPVSININNPQSMLNEYNVFSGAGFDIAGGMYYDCLKYLGIGLKFHAPVVAGRLSKVSDSEFSIKYTTDVKSLAGGDASEPEFKTEFGESVDGEYKINRPMKANLYVVLHPFDEYSYLLAGGGVGIRHPFAANLDEMKVYPEYELVLRLSIFNALSFDLSTEYISEIFKHQLIIELNLRLVEVDAGISLTGTDFVNSFKATGLGAFAGVSIGF